MEYHILNLVKVSFWWWFAPITSLSSPPPLSPHPLCSRHAGLVVVHQTRQTQFNLRPFALVALSTWHSPPSDILMAYSLTSSRFSFKYHLPNASLPWLLALLPIMHPIPSLLYFFSKNISSTSNTLDTVFIHASCLSSPLACQHYKRRDFCLFWPLLCSRAYSSRPINSHWMNICIHGHLLYDSPLLLELSYHIFLEMIIYIMLFL